MMSQTGGGCRASNYIHLIRKALKNQGLSHIPVISFNVSGLEKNPGFKLGPRTILQLLSAVNYGDVLMSLSNQTRPYELHKGETDALVSAWQKKILEEMKNPVKLRPKHIIKNIEQIARDFEQIERDDTPRVKVGIVGEIYIKYAALGNNNLEELLADEGAEIVMPSLLGFVMYCIYNVVNDYRLYKTSYLLSVGGKILMNFLYNYQDKMNKAITDNSNFATTHNFSHTIDIARGYIDTGVKMGEGWFLTAEMLELIDMGVDNIICTQPFGCLPNHIVGKGMMRLLKKNFPTSNIVAIDYDASATRINQENRIKLMLSMAKKNLEQSLSNEPDKQRYATHTLVEAAI
jgi:predicted nucleotide-binding protein (sugar kinase/HSP70/actin superfamily)